MPKHSFYKIISTGHLRRGVIHKILRNKHKRRLVLSISSVYLLLATVIGIGIFGPTKEQASANQPANIASVIRLENGEKLESGSEVSLVITLQNTSLNESINGINLNLLSSQNIIDWSQLSSKTKLNDGQSYVFEKNTTNIDFLAAGGKVDYIAKGFVQNHTQESTSILAKFSYKNQRGNEITESNRLFIAGGSVISSNSSPYNLTTDSNSYSSGEQINFRVNNPAFAVSSENSKTGKLYLTQIETKNVVDSFNCTFDEFGECLVSTNELKSGSYSGIFLDEIGNTSTIIEFAVISGDQNNFTPSEDASLKLPFKNISINGVVPIYANNLVGLNSTPKTGDKCKFVVSKNGTQVLALEAAVDSNRNCQNNLQASQLPGDGIYNIALAGTNQNQEVSILAKPLALSPINNKTVVLNQENPVELEISKVANNGTKATVGILHVSTGEYSEINNNGADDYISENSIIKAVIPAEKFTLGGLFQVFAKLNDGTQTDFINLNFDDALAGLPGSGVIVNNLDSLRIDNNITFSIQNILDRNNNPIALGDCQAEIYTTSKTNSPISVSGQIKNGTCSVEVVAGQINKAGPVTITFQGNDISGDINQSKQFNILAGKATTFGDINTEYSPARKNYANKVIVGPVTDDYGNLADYINGQLVITDSNNTIQFQKKLDIFGGFDETVIPAAVFNSDNLTLKVLDADGSEKITKILTVEEKISSLNLPSIPTELKSDENIKAKFNTEADVETKECSLTYYRSIFEAIETVAIPNSSYICNFDIQLNDLRDNKKGLLLLKAGNKTFTSLVENKPTEAVNNFTINPEIRVNEQNELIIQLLTSPIFDKQNLPVESEKMSIKYNGKVEEVQISNGHAKLELTADKLDTKDIRKNLNKSFLDLNLGAKAGVTSINSNNSLNIFIGQSTISKESGQIKVIAANNTIQAGLVKVFSFESDYCTVIKESKLGISELLKSHYQGGICYVEIKGEPGQYNLNFQNQGFSTGSYPISILEKEVPSILWCNSSPCNIEILGLVKESSAILFDDENEYKFDSNELGNSILIEENGLNPLKDYPIEITYKLDNGEEVTSRNIVKGEILLVK
jgi:hypothetical protein